jgi:hypothetical protein
MKIKISITRPEEPDNRGRITDNGYPSHSDTGRITDNGYPSHSDTDRISDNGYPSHSGYPTTLVAIHLHNKFV